ncbi:Calmodulin-binding domain [Parasponia andersonii]|uniref:Calmodulin-binding domain n=1 Tax=Parasponia andersonii TaxID=3476 RepID=A0A2P5D6G9_PARAD|nr:Calmodulin-binding domain [Parasponia andersonii]
MSESSIEIPLVQETIKPENVGVQRNATEKTNSPSSGMKVLSRYLRASTGSCHDYCKYGRKHEVEAKARFPIRNFIMERRGEGWGVETAASAERKIKFSISSKPSPGSETRKEVSSSSKKGTLSLEEDLSAFEGIDVSVQENPNNPNLEPKQSNLSSLPGHGCSINERNRETRKSKAVLEGQYSRRTSKNRSKERRTSLLGERKALVPPTAPLSTKNSVRRGPCTIARKTQNKIKDAEPENASNENIPEKTLYIIESTLENRTLEPTQDAVRTPNSFPSSTSTTGSNPYSQKISRPSRSGIPASQSPPSPSPSSPGNKGLRRIRKETHGTKPPLSSLSSTSPSEYLDSKENGVTSLHQTKLTEKKKVSLQAEHRIRDRGAGKLASESKNCSVQKMRFRRGTILDLKLENTTPRRLKFRRVKLLGEIQNGKEDIPKGSIESNEVVKDQNWEGKGATIKRSLRKKESSEGELISAKTNSHKAVLRHQGVEGTTTRRRSFRRKETNGSELGGTRTNSEKVVLRHQNVAGKKEVQSLFNNVIEETASKLVESRKSKVKALVGAFETVISLQDTKPSAATACAS